MKKRRMSSGSDTACVVAIEVTNSGLKRRTGMREVVRQRAYAAVYWALFGAYTLQYAHQE